MKSDPPLPLMDVHLIDHAEPDVAPHGRLQQIEHVRLRVQENNCLALRLRGYSYSEIAEELGIDDSTAHYAVTSALSRTAPDSPPLLRTEEVARLDHYLRKLDSKIQDGDTEAIRVALEVSRRRAALLGLDAPQRIDIRTVVLTLAKARGYDDEEAQRAVEFVMRHKTEALAAPSTEE